MQYQEFDINKARGVRIADAVRLSVRILKMGHLLDETDIEEMKKIGISRIFGVVMDNKDLSFQSALSIVAAKLCGDNTAYTVTENGIARIVAAADGIFECSDDRVAKFNRSSKPFILNTVEVYHKVKAGEVIADLALPMPVVTQERVDEVIYRLSGNVEMMRVASGIKRRVALVYTNLYNDKAEKNRFTKVVKKLLKEYADLGLEFVREYNAEHNAENLADTLEQVFRDGHDVIFIVPAQKTCCEQDVIPTALKSIVDEIISADIPKVGASDLIIAQKKNQKIISLPFAYDEVNSHLLHRYVLQAIVGGKLLAFSFEHPQNVFLTPGEMLKSEESEHLIGVSGSASAPGAVNVAAVVLAAGMSRRAGQNKLLVEVDGEPLFMKAVHAAVRSKASPVFVVTGYQNEEMEEKLENIDVNIVYNPDFRSGIKTSINLGLKSVPSFCKGCLLIPADMPDIADSQINKMIDVFAADKSKRPKVLVASYKKTRSNPILWSSELYSRADIIPEDAELRSIMMDVADYTRMVDFKDADFTLDVTFPDDVEQLQRRKRKA